MGQAFDESGRVLGEAFGDTKAEVFEKLSAEFPQAHELRIKSLKERLDHVERTARMTGSVSGQVPSVNRMVHYYDREEFVTATQQKRDPQPYPAVISRIFRDQEGNVITNVVTLHVFDPEVGGSQVKREKRLSVEPAPDCWCWPPTVAPARVPVEPAPSKNGTNRVAEALGKA